MNAMRGDKSFVYEIRVEGLLTQCWSDWFGEMEIEHEAGGETAMRGRLVDQAALFGVLAKIHALNLILISVNRLSSLAGCRDQSIGSE